MPEEIEVPTEHLHEKMEEEAVHMGGWISRVAVSSALLAVVAAISALLAGHHANEAILEQERATDQWALYQAKGIKGAILQEHVDLLEALDRKDKIRPDAEARVAKYAKEQKEIEDKGHELDESSEAHMAHHSQLARAVTLFQIAIALGAIAVLARRQPLWFVSLAAGAGGLVFLVLGLI